MKTPLLNDIAFGLVKDKVIEDKMKEYEMSEKQKEDIGKKDARAKQKSTKNLDNEETEELDENDLDEVDSEEERIMQKHIQVRMDEAEKSREAQKARLARKYTEYRDIVETEFLDTMIKNQKVVCHFYHDQFERCKIMDKHLKQIADLHGETMFVRINADKAPFFTVKLNVKILPTIICFNDGKATDRIVGFEELGMRDDFPTINLTRRLVTYKMITPLNKSEKGIIEVNLKNKKGNKKEDGSGNDSDY